MFQSLYVLVSWLPMYDAVQSLNHVQLLAILRTAAPQASLSFTISLSLLKLICIESVKPSNYLIFCHPLLLPSIFPSIRVFSNELAFCIRWPKNWSFSFSISPSSEYSKLISFRINWFDLLAAQRTLRRLLQKTPQCMHAKSFQSCTTHCNPMDHCPLDSSVHGILQASILEWVAMPSSRGSSQLMV